MDTTFLLDIHRYWFGELTSPDDFPLEKTQMWFRQSDEVDRHIRESWGKLIPEAAKVVWDAPRLAAGEAVALVVLFDQFPRNIFRDTGEAFAYDAKAREIARSLVASGLARFHWIEQSAIVIPFEHSEDIADQDLGMMFFAGLAAHCPEKLRNFNRILLDFGAKHREVIRTFGRFPHRNPVLGRESTPEEAAFVAEKGRGY